MTTYLICRASRPSVFIPSMISGCVAHAKFVSRITMPPLVTSAHEECWRVPSQYRLSKTLYGEAYQLARSGVGAGPAPLAPPARPAAGFASAGLAPGKQRFTNVAR